MAEVKLSIATGADLEELVAFVEQVFWKEETMAKALGVPLSEPLRRLTREMMVEDVAQPLSVVARAADTGCIVGCRTTAPKTTADALQYFDHINIDEYEPLGQCLMRFVERLVGGLHCDREPLTRDHNLAQFDIICVHPDFRKRGIARSMAIMSMDACRKAGHTGVVVLASGAPIQQLFNSMHFETMRSLAYADYTDDAGNQLIKPLNGSVESQIKFQKL